MMHFFDEEKKYLLSYVSNFIAPEDDKYNENIILKREHSFRVADNMLSLAKDLNLSESDTQLAGIIGIFHDIGRFTQYRKYHTFSDRDSVYHGDLGVEVLEETGRLNKYSGELVKIIKVAIHNHGLASIEENLSEKELLFSKLIRDADKLDIFLIVDSYYKEMLKGKRNISLELGLSNENKITDCVLDSFCKEHIILKSDMKTLNDFKILQLAWIFDMNFDYSRKRILKSGHLESIIESITINEIKDKLKTKCYEYLSSF